MIDLNGSIPPFISITEGKVHEASTLDWIIFEAGSFYVLNRGYVDFMRLSCRHSVRAYFVTKVKANMSQDVQESRPVNESSGLRANQTGRLNRTALPARLEADELPRPGIGKGSLPICSVAQRICK